MKRSGFSLIEVILATAILLGSVIVLSELAGIGRRQSQRAQLHSKAQELCERTLGEVLNGDRPALPVEDEPLLPPDSMLAQFENFEQQVLEEEEQLLIFETPEEQALLATGGDPAASDWSYSVQVVPLTEMPGLAAITVSVRQADPELTRPVRFSLTRWAEAPPSLEDGGAVGPFDLATPSGLGLPVGGIR